MARIITPEFTASYPNLFTPRAAAEGAEPKYSVTLVFPADADIEDLKHNAIQLMKERWGNQLANAKKVTLDTQFGPALFLRAGKFSARLPWNDSAEVIEEKGYPEGSTIVNARSNSKPQVVSLIPDENGKPSVITDETKVYPGVIARASLSVFTYDTNGNRGAAFGLGNVQIVRDGERIDGRKNAADEFTADPNATADLAAVGADDEDISDLVG